MARTLGLQSKSEWEVLCIQGERPSNIPAHPDQVYKKTGEWAGAWQALECKCPPSMRPCCTCNVCARRREPAVGPCRTTTTMHCVHGRVQLVCRKSVGNCLLVATTLCSSICDACALAQAIGTGWGCRPRGCRSFCRSRRRAPSLAPWGCRVSGNGKTGASRASAPPTFLPTRVSCTRRPASGQVRDKPRNANA